MRKGEGQGGFMGDHMQKQLGPENRVTPSHPLLLLCGLLLGFHVSLGDLCAFDSNHTFGNTPTIFCQLVCASSAEPNYMFEARLQRDGIFSTAYESVALRFVIWKEYNRSYIKFYRLRIFFVKL